jgi:hypothetical protein
MARIGRSRRDSARCLLRIAWHTSEASADFAECVPWITRAEGESNASRAVRCSLSRTRSCGATPPLAHAPVWELARGRRFLALYAGFLRGVGTENSPEVSEDCGALIPSVIDWRIRNGRGPPSGSAASGRRDVSGPRADRRRTEPLPLSGRRRRPPIQSSMAWRIR